MKSVNENYPLISVIVPVYKVELYLDRCVQSIVNQTYRNLEIILVDDGSPDNCPQMCDVWAERDSRIKVIHKVNGGVSSARNIGLDISKGKYICFVDSDDWVLPSFVEHMLISAEHWNVPIAICRMRIVDTEGGGSDDDNDVLCREINNKMAMTDLIEGGVVKGGACDKLYRRDILEGVRFPLGRRHEDEFFTHRVVIKAERLVFVDTELYCYLQQNGSFMHTITIAHLDMLDAMLERLELLREVYPDLYHKGKISICKYCIGYCRMIVRQKIDNPKSYIVKIRSYRKEVHFTISELFSYTVKELIYILASGSFPMLFAWFLQLRKAGSE